MDELQQLLALCDRVIVRVNDFYIDAELSRGFLGRCRLFQLVVVIVGGERNYKTKFFHDSTCA